VKLLSSNPSPTKKKAKNKNICLTCLKTELNTTGEGSQERAFEEKIRLE
jgi:hypothetical protein